MDVPAPGKKDMYRPKMDNKEYNVFAEFVQGYSGLNETLGDKVEAEKKEQKDRKKIKEEVGDSLSLDKKRVVDNILQSTTRQSITL